MFGRTCLSSTVKTASSFPVHHYSSLSIQMTSVLRHGRCRNKTQRSKNKHIIESWDGGNTNSRSRLFLSHPPQRVCVSPRMTMNRNVFKRRLFTFTPYTGSQSTDHHSGDTVNDAAKKASVATKTQFDKDQRIVDEMLNDDDRHTWMNTMDWTWDPTRPTELGLRQCMNLARQQSLSAALCAVYHLTHRMEVFITQAAPHKMGPRDFMLNMIPAVKNGSTPTVEFVVMTALEDCFMMMRHAESRGTDYTTAWIDRTNWLWVENMQDLALLQCIDLARRDSLYSFLKAISKMIHAIRIQDTKRKTDIEKLQQFKAAVRSLYCLSCKWRL